MATINMQTMRYINMLDKAAHVRTTKCFVYNNIIFFAVPEALVSKAIGPSALNIRKIQEKLGKKVKVIREPNGSEDMVRFIGDVVEPVKFKGIEVKDGIMVLTAGQQSKAALIGRNRRRLDELDNISRDFFGMELKIV